MTSSYIAPLDLKNIFLNIFAGSSDIFMGIFFIGLSVLAGVFRMPSQIYLLMVALSGILLYNELAGGFYILVVLVAGIITFISISKIVKN